MIDTLEALALSAPVWKPCWWAFHYAVWNYHLGGHKALRNWLSFLEKAILGRPRTLDQVRTVTSIYRRIAVLLVLGR